MAPRAVRRVDWAPSCATCSTSMAQAEAGGRWPFAGRRDAATRMWIVPGATGGVGGGALSRLRRRPPLVRVTMLVVSQCPLKRCQALWRGAAFGSHLAAWVALERSYCTLCVTRRRMARSMSLGLARQVP
eukprot:scaffold90158_cov29-Phaeocystis_antarctica.AAC.3